MSDRKADQLKRELQSGWISVSSLCAMFNWLPHSLRAVISGIELSDGQRVERRRENGITSYRIAETVE